MRQWGAVLIGMLKVILVVSGGRVDDVFVKVPIDRCC